MMSKPIFKSRLVFQKDVLAAARYAETIRSNRLGPEEKLMLAILQDAIECFQKHINDREVGARKLFIQTEQWLMNETGEGSLFSFENACETLQLHPDYLRKRLRDWKSKHCKRRPNVRPVKHSMAA